MRIIKNASWKQVLKIIDKEYKNIPIKFYMKNNDWVIEILYDLIDKYSLDK